MSEGSTSLTTRCYNPLLKVNLMSPTSEGPCGTICTLTFVFRSISVIRVDSTERRIEDGGGRVEGSGEGSRVRTKRNDTPTQIGPVTLPPPKKHPPKNEGEHEGGSEGGVSRLFSI